MAEEITHTQLAQQIGLLQGRVEVLTGIIGSVQKDVHEQRLTQAEIMQTLSGAKGSWKTLVALGAVAGSIGGIIMWAVDKIGPGG